LIFLFDSQQRFLLADDPPHGAWQLSLRRTCKMNSTFYKVHVLQENHSRFDCFLMGFKTIIDRL